MKPIKQYFFDFGGVLVDLDFNKSIEAFRKLGAIAPDSFYSEIYNKTLRDFENGMIGEKEFFEKLRVLLKIKASDREIRKAWNMIIRTIPKYKLAILQKLKNSFPVYMVSNTNITHIEYTRTYLFRENGYTIDDYFDKLYFSYEVGASKPDSDFYRRVIADAGIDPSESLFLDDRTDNIDGARHAGFQVCHVRPEDDLREKLFPFLKEFSL
ncbi:HAD family hydrolase [Coprobacter sp.]